MKGSADTKQLDMFLRSVERRAYYMAVTAVSNPQDALDLVQDAMTRFVAKYSNKPEEERKPLFYRTLTNAITDFHRRKNVRNRVLSAISWLGLNDNEDTGPDPISLLPDPGTRSMEDILGDTRFRDDVNVALKKLPLRQQQAFLLRAVEELSVADTAQAMGVSAGSVKTHYFRALAALRDHLQGYQP
ncbi:RNA polymerase sigma factor [Desulfovibrio inopinatus]|uniref:RNA polymerase sigma factor n=1 Tax=Desulfovibrio inopinatus TaxID=102109 RepID=UPI00040430BD|nr:RNA polymerase sigma factor [Desulfovibrio inopinatus]